LIFRNFEYLLSLNTEPHLVGAAECGASQPVLPAGIRQLEGEMVVLNGKQAIRIICLSRHLLGVVL
jgi:hypothetical protein